MQTLRLWAHSAGLVLTIWGTVAGLSTANAQGRCTGIHGKSNIAQNADLIQNVDSTLNELRLLIEKKPETLDPIVAQTQILMGRMAEYLSAARMTFSVAEAQIEIEVAGKPLTLRYPQFLLEGNPKGDEISRMIYGFQQSREYQKRPTRVLLDPLFGISGARTYGAFYAKHLTILLSPAVLRGQLFGRLATLRHEIQHYFEHIKILDGEMTLARLEMTQKDRKTQGPYAEYVSVSEIETHLRDIRLLQIRQKSTEHQSVVEAALEKIASQSYEAVKNKSLTDRNLIELERQETLASKFETTRNLINDTRNAIRDAQKQIDNGEWTANVKTADTGFDVDFRFDPAQSYSQMSVNLTGILKMDSLHPNSNAWRTVLEVFAFAKKRIDDIEKEIDVRFKVMKERQKAFGSEGI